MRFPIFFRQFLNKANREHLVRYPQLACFFFDLITTFIHLEGQYQRDQLALLARDVFPSPPDGSACLDVGGKDLKPQRVFLSIFCQSDFV